MFVCVLVGDYLFSVDCQCHNVDIVFTENETNSLRRDHVLHKRQLKDSNNAASAGKTNTDEEAIVACLTQPADSCLPSACSTTACSECAAETTGTCSSVELSQLPSADEVVFDTRTDSSDTDSYSDDDSDSSYDDGDSSLHLQSSEVTAQYTKDAFHKYIIAGNYTLFIFPLLTTELISVEWCVTLYHIVLTIQHLRVQISTRLAIVSEFGALLGVWHLCLCFHTTELFCHQSAE